MACARIHSGIIHATKGCRKVTFATLRIRSMDSGLAHDSSWFGGVYDIVTGYLGGNVWKRDAEEFPVCYILGFIIFSLSGMDMRRCGCSFFGVLFQEHADAANWTERRQRLCSLPTQSTTKGDSYLDLPVCDKVSRLRCPRYCLSAQVAEAGRYAVVRSFTCSRWQCVRARPASAPACAGCQLSRVNSAKADYLLS